MVDLWRKGLLRGVIYICVTSASGLLRGVIYICVTSASVDLAEVISWENSGGRVCYGVLSTSVLHLLQST